MATTLDGIAATLLRMERRQLQINRELIDLNEGQLNIMETLETIGAKVTTLVGIANDALTAATEAKNDSAALVTQNEATIGLLQALSAKIGELSALVAARGFTPEAQAKLDALGGTVQSVIDTLTAATTTAAEANAERDAALATQRQAVIDATPAP